MGTANSSANSMTAVGNGADLDWNPQSQQPEMLEAKIDRIEKNISEIFTGIKQIKDLLEKSSNANLPARKRERSDDDNDGPKYDPNAVYVVGTPTLPKNVTEWEIRNIFEQFGEIVDVMIQNPSQGSNYIYVFFRHPEHATNALRVNARIGESLILCERKKFNKRRTRFLYQNNGNPSEFYPQENYNSFSQNSHPMGYDKMMAPAPCPNYSYPQNMRNNYY